MSNWYFNTSNVKVYQGEIIMDKSVEMKFQ